MGSHGVITFAGGLFQTRSVQQNLYGAAAVPDKPGLLKSPGNEADAGPMYAQHIGQIFLRELEFVAAHPVMAHQHPACKAFFKYVQPVAGYHCETWAR